MAVGDKILKTDYNSTQDSVQANYGTGSGSRGYGQEVQSVDVEDVTKVSPSEWNTLRYDLLNARAHQIGTNPALSVIAATGSKITEDDKAAFASLASTIDSNRLTAHSSRLTSAGIDVKTRTTSWTSTVTCTITQTFANATEARYWYNTGGRIIITSQRSGGSPTQQNNSWTTILSSAGFAFDASRFYSASLTTSYSRVYTITSTAPYSSNQFYIDAKANQSPNNASGGATVVDLRVTWNDPYTDPSPGNPPAPDDLVDGTLQVFFNQTFAGGGQALTPSGTWKGFGFSSGQYTPPSYSVTNITGS